MKFDLGVKCRWFLSMKPGDPLTQENFFIGIAGGKIQVVEKFKSSHSKSCKKFLKGDHHAVLPGFVNGHAHLPMSLFRGAEDDAPLKTWLFDRVFPLESKFVRKKFAQAGTELSALEAIRFGVTTTNDMYFYAEDCAKIWDTAGLRGIFYQVFMDFPIPEDGELGPDRWSRFLKTHSHFKNHPRIQYGLGPHAPYTCSDDILREVGRLSAELKCPIQIHLSETVEEVRESFEKFKLSPVERLQALKVLTARTNCAHGVHLSAEDLRILKETGASVVHNPDSNSKLSAGVAPVPLMLQMGIPVGLGTDGVVSNNSLNMFRAMDVAAKMHKLASGNSEVMKTREVLVMATLGSARALGLQDQVGSLEVGKEADLLLVDLSGPHLQPVNDVASHLVYACSGLEVDTVVCAGKILYQNGKYTTLDPQKIIAKASAFGKKVQAELKKMKS
jgi:5-methylthioadenosine/S-adenosylhomocysteine deaminase